MELAGQSLFTKGLNWYRIYLMISSFANVLYNKLHGRAEKEDLKYVWEAVKKLPVKNREVIHLFYQEGYSTKEIADILKRREATVRSDLKRGREKLKKILKEAYDFE